MGFWTWPFPMSTFICILQVQLDVDQQKHKKQVSLKSRVWPVIYNGNSTFRPSHFFNTRFSKVDFALYFTGVIWCFLTKAFNSLSKTILFDSGRSLFLSLGPFGPLLFAWVSQGCLQASKSCFYLMKTTTFLETYRFAYVKPMFLPQELPCGGLKSNNWL